MFSAPGPGPRDEHALVGSRKPSCRLLAHRVNFSLPGPGPGPEQWHLTSPRGQRHEDPEGIAAVREPGALLPDLSPTSPTLPHWGPSSPHKGLWGTPKHVWPYELQAADGSSAPGSQLWPQVTQRGLPRTRLRGPRTAPGGGKVPSFPELPAAPSRCPPRALGVGVTSCGEAPEFPAPGWVSVFCLAPKGSGIPGSLGRASSPNPRSWLHCGCAGWVLPPPRWHRGPCVPHGGRSSPCSECEGLPLTPFKVLSHL